MGTDAAPTSRTIPQNPEAEMACLGSCCLGGLDTVATVLGIIPAEHDQAFYSEPRRELFRALCAMHDARCKIDLVTVTHYLDKSGRLPELGGEPWLVGIAESVPSPVHAEYYAKIVAEKYHLRQLLRVAGELQERVYEPDANPIELAAGVSDQLSKVESGTFSELDVEPAEQTFDRVLLDISSREPEHKSYISTGFNNIDALITGVSAGELIVIGARSSMGKSSLAANLAYRMALPHPRFPVALLSFEMTREKIMARLISMASNIALREVKTADKTQEMTIQMMAMYRHDIAARPLYIIDTRGKGQSNVRTLPFVLSLIRQVNRKRGARAFFIDYLQLMDVPGLSREPRHFRVQIMTAALKALAEELGVIIFIVCQINREGIVAGKLDQRPSMANLRESGAIEQDADQVWLLHRPVYYDRAGIWKYNQSVREYAELIIDKNRDGETGIAALRWIGQYQQFEDMDQAAADLCLEATSPKRKPADDGWTTVGKQFQQFQQYQESNHAQTVPEQQAEFAQSADGTPF